MEFIPVDVSKDCFNAENDVHPAPELPDNLGSKRYLHAGSFIRSRKLGTEGEEHVWGFHHRYPLYYDPRTFAIQVTLYPDTFYLYGVTVRSMESVMPLYWKIGAEEQFLERNAYPQWTRLGLLFATPHWDGEPQVVSISPALWDHFSDVYIKDYHLAEVSIPPEN
jgi:hypothetical protein